MNWSGEITRAQAQVPFGEGLGRVISEARRYSAGTCLIGVLVAVSPRSPFCPGAALCHFSAP